MEAKGCEDLYEHVQSDIIYTITNIPGPGIDIEEFESEFSSGCNCDDNKCDENCSCNRYSVNNYIDYCILDEKLSGPIIECNEHCKCSRNCGNRLVQNGPLDCLLIKSTESKGLSLETKKSIRKGQFICEYAGEVIGLDEARRRIESNKSNNSMNYVLVVFEHCVDNKIIKTCIDPKSFGNIGRYCNHSCEPNASLVPVRIEGIVPRLCLFALRDISEGEEITFNYAGENAKGNSVQNLSHTPCLCGSSKCLRYLPHHPI